MKLEDDDMVAGPASFGGDDALDRAESGTAPGSPLGEAFSWLHSAEKKHGGVTNPLFGWLSRSGTTSHASPQVHPKCAQSPAPSAPGEESSFLYKRAVPRNPVEYSGRLSEQPCSLLTRAC